MTGFVIRMLITALGLWLASEIVPGFELAGLTTLLAAALLLGIVNAVIRPVLLFLTLPITLLTLGIFILVINGAMVGLVAKLLKGFTIDGFGSAFLGALIVALTSWVASSFIGSRGRFATIYVRRDSRHR
jgi:putative membrane protein